MKVSVIVPVYNVQDYLPKCIDSILNQTYEDFELILINDGSTDSSGEICDKYASSDNRVRVIHQSNSGPSAARNAGLDVAKGDYISFVDSDDYIHNQMLETMVKKITGTQADIAICNYAFVDYQGNTIEHDSTIESESFISQDNLLGLLAKGWLPAVIPCNKLYERSIFDNLRYPSGKRYEDDFIAHKIIARAKKILLIPDYFYYYLQREGSMSKNQFSIEKFDRIESLLDRSDFLKSIGKDKYSFYSLVDAIVRLTIYWKYKKTSYYSGVFRKYRKTILARYKTTRYYLSDLKYSAVLFLFKYCFPLLRIMIRFTFGREAF